MKKKMMIAPPAQYRPWWLQTMVVVAKSLSVDWVIKPTKRRIGDQGKNDGVDLTVAALWKMII